MFSTKYVGLKMKIICFYNNYPQLSTSFSEVDVPLFYMKPDTSILTNNRPFYIPEFVEQLYCQVELVLKINKLGKYIQENFAPTYFQEIATGVNFFDKEKLNKAIEKGLPWESSCVFENSAAISPFYDKENFGPLDTIRLKLVKNNTEIFQGDTSACIYSSEQLISFISQYFTMKTGDILFLGSPIIPISLAINDLIEVYLGEEKTMKFRIK